ncbi:MAG: TRAP transporter small permease [Desulfobulbaceae bacterium]|nr:TRAP transporter small permease [Desulfobulbaceae bacterium]
MPGTKEEKKLPSFKCDDLNLGVLTADAPKNFFDKIIINSFSIVCFSTTVLLTVIICAAAFFRYILDGDLTGYEEWVKIFAFWLYFAAAAIGAYNRTHVSADLVHAYVPDGRLKDFLVFLKNLITVGVSLLFTWYGYEFFMFGFMGPLGTGIAIPTTNVWRISLWIGYLAVFLGLIFMTYYFTRDLFISTRTLLLGRRNK